MTFGRHRLWHLALVGNLFNQPGRLGPRALFSIRFAGASSNRGCGELGSQVQSHDRLRVPSTAALKDLATLQTTCTSRFG